MMSLLLMKVFGGGAACCANALEAKAAVIVTAMMDVRMKASRYQLNDAPMSKKMPWSIQVPIVSSGLRVRPGRLTSPQLPPQKVFR
jgi:hypothetical protein